MSKIKHSGLDQYGTGPFEQQQFGTAGVEGVKRLSWDQRQDTINRAIYQLLNILTVMTRAYNGHAESCLNWNVYNFSVNCEFYRKRMQKMNVIAKISYLERSVVTLKLCNEYLNRVTQNTPVLLWIKNRTV